MRTTSCQKNQSVTLLWSCFCVLFITLLLSSCNSKRPHKNTDNNKDIIITQAFENLLYLGLYVAQDGGFFTNEGLNVKIETAGGDAQAFAALTSGNCDFSQGDPAFVAIANEKGWQGKVLAVVVNRAALWGVTFDDSIEPVKDIKALKGKTIAVFPNPNTSYVIQKQLLEKANLKIGEDVKLIEVPLGTELATLKNGTADIAQTLEPNVAQVEQQGGTCVLSYPDFYGEIAFSGLMASQKYIDNNKETVKKIIKAYNSALSYIHSDLDGTVKIAMKYFPEMDSAIIVESVKRLIESNSIPSSTYISQDSWNKLLQIRHEVGDLKEMPKEILIDNSFQ